MKNRDFTGVDMKRSVSSVGEIKLIVDSRPFLPKYDPVTRILYFMLYFFKGN